jgi:MEMO1 family protein
MHVREAAVSNQFYPGNPGVLKQSILEYLSSATVADDLRVDAAAGKLKGVIVPHAGYVYSGAVAASSFNLLKHLDKGVKWKVLLMGPSHTTPFMGAAPFREGIWKTPLGAVAVNDIRDELADGANDDELIVEVIEAHRKEHSLEVQLPFLQSVLSSFVVYPLILGNLRPDFLADRLAEFVARDDVIVVVSSDLSHHLPFEEALKVDEATVTGIAQMDTDSVIEKGDACGLKGILTMMLLAEKFGWKPSVLDYKNSGHTGGDKSAVVGYGSVGWFKGD